MLTVAKITQGGAAGYADYLDGCSRASELGDYYLKDGQRVEAPGRWAGDVDALGVDPEAAVTGEQLRALMAVRQPSNGAALRRVGGDGRAVAAIDATFSAPKSVSAVWAAANPGLRALIESAHEHAVDAALAYAVNQVAMIRERVSSDTVIHANAAAVLATSWRHTTARAVAGRDPDPQLHSHVLLHGAVRRDGRVVAIDSRAWLVHRRELGAAYRTELAHELSRLGFGIDRGTGRGGRYFEIEDVPLALLDEWSARHHQVREAIEQRLAETQAELERQAAVPDAGGEAAAARLEMLRASGQLSPREDRHMTTASRTAKRHLLTKADLDRDWSRTAGGFGLDSAAVRALRARGRQLSPAEDRVLLGRLTEFEATFSERAARAVALEACAGTPIAKALDGIERLRASGQLLALSDGQYTTSEHRARERATLHLARSLAAGRVDPIPRGRIGLEVATLSAKLESQRSVLSDEQQHALELGCSDRQVVMIEGQAGSGKSTVLSGIARAHQAEGQRIIATSTAALAAQRLAADLRVEGVDAGSYSTAALHAAVARDEGLLGIDTTVIHDEAALASTIEQHRLLTAVTASGGRLIEVGDRRQSRPVGAGGLWPGLEGAARENAAHVRLTRNVRALDPEDRRDQRLFRDRQIEQALAGYQRRDRLTLTDDQHEAEERALQAAHADGRARRRTMVIAQTSNEHLDELNARAQAIQQQHTELGPESIPVKGRPYGLHANDRVQVRRSFQHPFYGRVANGTAGEIAWVMPDRELAGLRLDSGEYIRLDREQIDHGDLRLAYVQHPFPAQGQTTDTAHLIISEHATREGSYVAITRARQQTRIYAAPEPDDSEPADDRLAALAERMARTDPEAPSIQTPLAHEQSITAVNDSSLVADRDQFTDDERELARAKAVLGHRPDSTDSAARDTWDRAGESIHAYRTRYWVAPDEPTALGPEPAPGNFKQRHERNRVAREVLRARWALGLDQPWPGACTEEARDVAGLAPEPDASERENAYEREP